jgi:outer membrane protein assembly factor BamB
MPTIVASAISLFSCVAAADDWPEWRGPQRSGVSSEKDWLSGWAAGSTPVVAWRASVGKGHSAVSVSKGKAYTVGWDGQQDTVYCFNAANGKPIWKQSYPCKTIYQWPGPRATPTVDGSRVYTLGQHGQLYAFDAATGEKAWSVQLSAGYMPDVDYGFAWSPLVEGEFLILAAGKRGLAVKKSDGSFAWGNDGQHGACASAVRYSHKGQRGVALITTEPGRDSVSLVGVDPTTGRELWRWGPWLEKWGAACVDPIVQDGKVFVTTAEQRIQNGRFSMEGNTLREDWSNKELACYTGGCVLVNGHLYGVNKTGILKCLDWDSGKEVWSQRGFDQHGTLIAADGMLIVQSSKTGTLAVVEATPKGYRELRRAMVFSGEPNTFTAPVLANGRVYCRSYAGEIVCLAVGK